MPKRIEEPIRLRVARLWLKDFSYDQCAEKTGISVNSARNFIDELKAGKYRQYESYLGELEDLRWMSRQLRSNNMSLVEAVTGLAIFTALAEMGIDPKELDEFLRLMRKIAPPDFPVESFVQAAMRIAELEKEMGVDFQDLHVQYQREASQVKELAVRRRSLAEAVKAASDRLREILMKEKVTIETLQQYARDRRTLHEAGLGLNDLGTAADFIRKSKAEGALDTAVELFTLESKTGKNHTTLLKEYKAGGSVQGRIQARSYKTRRTDQEFKSRNCRTPTAKKRTTCGEPDHRRTTEQLHCHPESVD